MPKRNRKCDEGLSMAALTGKWVLLAAMAVSLSLLYVWQHVQLVRTGYTIKRIEREVAEWQKTNETLKLENERLTEEKRLLETDINYVEKKAREKIGVVRKGEIVLKEVPVRK